MSLVLLKKAIYVPNLFVRLVEAFAFCEEPMPLRGDKITEKAKHY
jgi:hypothetical protein